MIVASYRAYTRKPSCLEQHQPVTRWNARKYERCDSLSPLSSTVVQQINIIIAAVATDAGINNIRSVKKNADIFVVVVVVVFCIQST